METTGRIEEDCVENKTALYGIASLLNSIVNITGKNITELAGTWDLIKHTAEQQSNSQIDL